LTTVLEKLKALDAQRAELLEGAKKEALDNAEKAVAELNKLGLNYSLTEGQHQQRERRVKPLQKLKPQSAKRETFPARSATSKRPLITMGECIGHKRQRGRST
jgi:hypothetical protein